MKERLVTRSKSIVIHQNTRFVWVPFVPKQTSNAIAKQEDDAMLIYTISFIVR